MKKAQIPYRDLFITGLLLAILYWFSAWIPFLITIPIFIAIGFLVKELRTSNHWFWEKTTLILSFIFPPIFMTLIFFLAVVPIGLLSRVFKKKKELSLGSNFHDVDQKFDLVFFEKLW